MKKFFILATTPLVCGMILFSSCKKKEVEDNDTAGATDHSLAETIANDIVNIGHQASYGQSAYNSNGTYRQGGAEQIYTTCATLKFDTAISTDADTLTVDFGTTGCTGKDNRKRSGVLRYVYTAGKHYRDSANIITVSTPGNTFSVDNDQVIINSKTITNKGHLINGQLTWAVSSDIQINFSSGAKLNWSCSRTKVLLAGEKPMNQPVDWPHARVAVFGSANGNYTKADGTSGSFTANVNQSTWLVRDFNCGQLSRFFVSGILDFTPNNKPTRYVNFGSGNCDNDAVVSIGKNTYNVILH